MPDLRTERLVLRAPQPADARALHAICADPDVTRYLKWAPHVHMNQTLEYLVRAEGLEGRGKGYAWIIERDGRVVGCASACAEEQHSAIFGGFFAREHWRSGYGLEAARAVLEWLQANPRIERVSAQSDVRNQAVAVLLSRIGMHCEGKLASAWPGFGEPARDVYTWAWVRKGSDV